MRFNQLIKRGGEKSKEAGELFYYLNEALGRVADLAAHQGRCQGLLSRQEVARSRGLGLPAGAPLPRGFQLWLTRGSKRVLSLEEKGSLRPEMGKVAFPLGFRKEEVPHMAVSAKLDEITTRKMAGIVGR